MKVIKFFIIFSVLIIVLGSCQKRVTFRAEQSLIHYDKLLEFYTRFENGNVDEIVHNYIMNQLRRGEGIIEDIEFSRETRDIIEKGSNIVCRFYPQHSRRIMLVSNYSGLGISRSDNRKKEIEQMSFGISLQLETARLLSTSIPNQYGVDLIFLDSVNEDNLINGISPAFRELIAGYDKPKPEVGVYLCLNPSAEISLPIDEYSYQKLPYIVYRIWTTAENLGWKEFKKRIETTTLLKDEELLYSELNVIKLQNDKEETEEILPDQLLANFRLFGSLFKELIYGKD